MNYIVASVGFEQRALSSEKEFEKIFESHLAYANYYKANIVIFPEYVTSSLLSLNNNSDFWTDYYVNLLKHFAHKYQAIIVGGSHLRTFEGRKLNTCFVAFPDGSLHAQDKIHLIPFERDVWKMSPGTELCVFDLGFSKFAVAICYDIEFTSIVNALTNEGVDLICVPSYTADRSGYWRVRHCAQARCVENQIFVAQSSIFGAVIGDLDYCGGFGNPGIYSPCDIGFPADGVIAIGENNTDMCVVAELNLPMLYNMREHGNVTPLKDKNDFKSIQRVKIKTGK